MNKRTPKICQSLHEKDKTECFLSTTLGRDNVSWQERPATDRQSSLSQYFNTNRQDRLQGNCGDDCNMDRSSLDTAN